MPARWGIPSAGVRRNGCWTPPPFPVFRGVVLIEERCGQGVCNESERCSKRDGVLSRD